MIKYIKFTLFPSFFLFLLTGCLSYTVSMKAEYGFQDEKITKIDSAFIDSENNLYVSFEITDENSEKSSHFFKVNLDTIQKKVAHSDISDYAYFEKKTKKSIGLKSLYKTDFIDSLFGIEVTCSEKIYKNKGISIPKDAIRIDTSQLRYNYKGRYQGIYGFPSFSYYPDEKIVTGNDTFLYYMFSLEKIVKGKKILYALFPFTIILDIITLPIQLVILLILNIINK